jgi:hypothetical protein
LDCDPVAVSKEIRQDWERPASRKPDPAFPDEFADRPADRERAWWDAYIKTEEGKRVSRRRILYAAKVASKDPPKLPGLPAAPVR